MGVPHTRPLGLTAHGTRPGLVVGSRPIVDRLQVPGSVASLLEFRLGEQDRAAVGFAVHVPHYLAQAAYPAAAVALLESVTRATGLSLPDQALREAARRTDEEIGRQVEASEEIAELVEAQDDATLLAIRAQEQAGLDILTDGEMRRESYSNRFATALDGVDIDNPGTALDRSGHPNPVPRVTGPIRRRHPVEIGDVAFLRANTRRTVK